jgi:predicted amidohydrolase
VAQINFDPGNVTRHVQKIKDLISLNRKADLIVFPELILHGHPSKAKPEGYLYRNVRVQLRRIFREVRQHVRRCDARVIIGELRRRGDLFSNTATYVDRKTTQRYFKTHVHWTEQFLPGDELGLFQTPLGPVGITICFDSAFSEVWRVLALQGAEVIVNISAVPAEFPARYMRRRLQGAAVFNQVFVIYANRPGPYFSGHSAVYDPRGEEVCAAGDEETVLSAQIDLAQVRAWREQEMVYPFRRPKLYREIASQGKSAPEKELVDHSAVFP